MSEIKRLHAENYGVYGVRKMWHLMRREGWNIGRDQVLRLMRKAGLKGVTRAENLSQRLVLKPLTLDRIL